jgi:glycosyltransferase involved in cell wall biosynthesis
MDIALMHYAVPPVIGGVESVLAHHARLMAGAGHAVRVVAARGEHWSNAVDFFRLPLADSLHPEILAAKRELDSGRIPPSFEDLVRRIAEDLLPVVADADLLIAHNVCSLNMNLALTTALHCSYRRPGFPRLVLWHHDLAWATPRYLPELHEGPPWELLRSKWPGAAHVAVSDLRRRELSALTGIPAQEIRVIPNGIRVEEFLRLEDRTAGILKRLDLLRAAPLILLPVRITPRKNLEFALRALARLRRDFPDAAAVITGPIGAHNPENLNYFQDLLELRHTLGLDSAAHFLAELEEEVFPDSVIADFYRLADALFLPSREEGFGIPLLEAGLSHCPVFCADLPALRELGGESAAYFSPDGEPEQAAALIARQLSGSTVFRLATVVRRDFQWDRIYREAIEPLLEQILRNPDPRRSGS